MSFDHRHYVPCLRWKQGEYQAVHQLPSAAKKIITPLIEIPEIGYDFETGTTKKFVDGHLVPQAKRIKKKWGTSLCFVDLRHISMDQRMVDGTHPVNYIFSELRKENCQGIATTDLERDQRYQQAIKQAIHEDNQGICLRITLEQAATEDIKKRIRALLTEIDSSNSECDLVLDYGAPNFVPLDGFYKVVKGIIRRLPNLAKWRTFTLLGTSFPKSMAEVRRGVEFLDRYEWILYQRLVRGLSTAGVRLPTFGDYAISHPDVPNLDWRLVTPAASIRYTADNAWYIVKGQSVRGEKKFAQYREHCNKVIASPYYCGPTFSAGDKYIADCAAGTESTGNLTTWRKVGTNHHLAKLVHDISSFSWPSSGL